MELNCAGYKYLTVIVKSYKECNDAILLHYWAVHHIANSILYFNMYLDPECALMFVN